MRQRVPAPPAAPPEPAGPCVPLPPTWPVAFGEVVELFIEPLAPVGVGVLDMLPLLPLLMLPLLLPMLPLLPMLVRPAQAPSIAVASTAATRVVVFLEEIMGKLLVGNGWTRDIGVLQAWGQAPCPAVVRA
jgi:hypothetical protein